MTQLILAERVVSYLSFRVIGKYVLASVYKRKLISYALFELKYDR